VVDPVGVHDVSRVSHRHEAAWGAAARVAAVAAVLWLGVVLAVERVGHLTPLLALVATVLAGAAIGVRLPAAAPALHRLRAVSHRP